MTYKGEDAHKIVTILEEYEARSDYLALMRQQNGIGSIVDCQIGKEVDLSGINLQELSALKNTDKPNRASKPDSEQKSCVISVALCTNQGVGVDDCMRSVATCSVTHSSVSDEHGFCCSASFKEQYNAARCSGLKVFETFSWLDRQ